MTDLSMDVGRASRPIHEGDRVKHVTDDLEGIAERIDWLGVPTVAVRLDTGAVVFFAESFLERAP